MGGAKTAVMAVALLGVVWGDPVDTMSYCSNVHLHPKYKHYREMGFVRHKEYHHYTDDVKNNCNALCLNVFMRPNIYIDQAKKDDFPHSACCRHDEEEQYKHYEVTLKGTASKCKDKGFKHALDIMTLADKVIHPNMARRILSYVFGAAKYWNRNPNGKSPFRVIIPLCVSCDKFLKVRAPDGTDYVTFSVYYRVSRHRPMPQGPLEGLQSEDQVDGKDPDGSHAEMDFLLKNYFQGMGFSVLDFREFERVADRDVDPWIAMGKPVVQWTPPKQ